MLIHSEKSFCMLFGSKKEAYNKENLYNISSLEELDAQNPFKTIKQTITYSALVFLNQVHGINGKIITDIHDTTLKAAHRQDGDFLITNQKGIALGIGTADCLPLIFFDTKNGAIGIAHAGWKGAVAGIAQAMFSAMISTYGSKTHDLRIFFGPSAGVCCYQVSADFLKHVPNGPWIEERENKLFFNNTGLIREQLNNMNIPDQQIIKSYHTCTICNQAFCSYRREPQSALRQPTIVLLY